MVHFALLLLCSWGLAVRADDQGAGMAHMPYRTFLACNIAGAIAWGTLSVLLGYLGGTSWRHAASVSSHIGLALLVVVALAATVGWFIHRRRTLAGRPDGT